VAGSIGQAAAQYYPPPPPAYPPPQAYPEPSYTPPPYGGAPSVYASGVPYDPRHDERSAPDAGFAPQPMPTVDGAPIMRPPSDVGGGPDPVDVTGSVRAPIYAAPPAGPNRGPVIAALPPDEQPEQGPRKEPPPQFRRQLVDYPTTEPAGTIIVDTPNTFLYLILGHGKALRYGIGVGREGFTWSGSERISRVKEWPDWFPPKEMIERQPYLPRFMAGGESNPLGARALYLGNTLFRIHGTNQPSTIGTFVSSGCIRLTNEDIEDLYSRVGVGTRVVVLPGALPNNTASAQTPIAQ